MRRIFETISTDGGIADTEFNLLIDQARTRVQRNKHSLYKSRRSSAERCETDLDKLLKKLQPDSKVPLIKRDLIIAEYLLEYSKEIL